VNCEEIQRSAHLYMDSEFDEGERVLFEQHLADCPECREEVNGLMSFQQALRHRLGRHRMPAEARHRVMSTVFGQRKPERARWKFYALAAAAAAMVVVVAAGLFQDRLTPSGGEVDRLVTESIAAHEASLPPEVEGNNDQIKGYLARHAQGETQPPLSENEQTRLVGVRLARIGNTRALLYRYLHRGRDISVVQMPNRLKDAANLPRPTGVQAAKVLYSGPKGGHSVTLYESPGYTNAVIGDIPQNDLLKLVPASL
jgi:anti-sigma factor RsiW